MGRRGGIAIWSSSITPGENIKNNYIAEFLQQKWDLQAPHQAPQYGGLELGRWAPRAFGFEDQWCLILGAPQDLGEYSLHS